MKQLLNSIFYSLLCVSCILLGTFLLSQNMDIYTYRIVMNTSLSIVCGIGLFLALRFKKDETFFLIFFSMLAYILIEYLSMGGYYDNYFMLVAFPVFCLLYPINLYVLTRLRRTEIFLSSFFRKIFILMIEAFFIYVFTYFLPSLLGKDFLYAFEKGVYFLLNYSFNFYLTPVPPLSIVLFIVFFTLCLLQLHRESDYLKVAFLNTFLLTFISLMFVRWPYLPSSLFLAAFGNVLLALLQVSHKMAFLDELTNIPGRRALMTELAQLESQNYTLAIVDIDFFKRLNDSYGHEVGDQALRMISSHLAHQSASGHLFRYGGEEFILLFQHHSLESVLDEIEETRKKVSTTEFFLRAGKKIPKENRPYLASIQITLSIGVSEKIRPDESIDSVINLADKALYKAKQTGRNKTVYHKDGKFYELF